MSKKKKPSPWTQKLEIVRENGITTISLDGHKLKGVTAYQLNAPRQDRTAELTVTIAIVGDSIVRL